MCLFEIYSFLDPAMEKKMRKWKAKAKTALALLKDIQDKFNEQNITIAVLKTEIQFTKQYMNKK